LSNAASVAKSCENAMAWLRSAKRCVEFTTKFLSFYDKAQTCKLKSVILGMQTEQSLGTSSVTTAEKSSSSCDEYVERHRTIESKWKATLKKREVAEKKESKRLASQATESKDKKESSSRDTLRSEKQFKKKPSARKEQEWSNKAREEMHLKHAFKEKEVKLMKEEAAERQSEVSSAVIKTWAAKTEQRRVASCKQARDLSKVWLADRQQKQDENSAEMAKETSKAAKLSKLASDLKQELAETKAIKETRHNAVNKAATELESASRLVADGVKAVQAAEKDVVKSKENVAQAKLQLQQSRADTEADPSAKNVAALKVSMHKFKAVQADHEAKKEPLTDAHGKVAAANDRYYNAKAQVKLAQTHFSNAEMKVSSVQERTQTNTVALKYSQQTSRLLKKHRDARAVKLANSRVTHEKLLAKCDSYKKEAKQAQEEGAKAAAKANLNENESKTKKVTKEAIKKKDKELMEKAGTTRMKNERKYKTSLEARKKEQLSKDAMKKVETARINKIQKEAKIEEQKEAAAAEAIAEKKKFAKMAAAATSRYAADALDPKAFPVVCMRSADRLEYAPLSSPVSKVMLKVINALLEQAQIKGAISPAAPWQEQRESTKLRITKFQKSAGIQDMPGCLSKPSWDGLMRSCPFPLGTNYCHEYRPCVLAFQIMLYAYYPAGKTTGRFCKETQIQLTKFQRLTQSDATITTKLFASGQAQSLDFITLLRQNGLK